MQLSLRPTLTAIALTLMVAAAPAKAQTLEEALALAYANNPELDAQRAQVRVTDENLPQAQAGYQPNVSGQLSIGHNRSWTDPGTRTQNTDKSASVSVVQPIYRGGRTTANIARAKSDIAAERARLKSVEQSVLFDAAKAYYDVVRDEAVLQLNLNNERVLGTQLRATRDRFDVGEVTTTDVSQADASLAGATAGRIAAEAQLKISRGNFLHATGQAPENLKETRVPFALPKDLAEVIDLAIAANPTVTATKANLSASKHAVDQISGELLPEINLIGQASRSYDPNASLDRADQASVEARMSIPIFPTGAVYSRIRAAKQAANKADLQVEQAIREVTDTATQAWQTLSSSQAAIKSREAQVRAAGIALEGVRQEAAVGSRSTLDILDAEQSVLDARVGLERVKHDYAVAAFQVAAAVGRLDPESMELDIPVYNPQANLNRVDNKWFGGDVQVVRPALAVEAAKANALAAVPAIEDLGKDSTRRVPRPPVKPTTRS